MQTEEKTANFTRVANLLNTLFLLGKHLSLYHEENKLVTATTARLEMILEELFAELPQLSIVVARHGFLFDGEFIQRSNKLFEKFALRMFEHGIATFSLTPELNAMSIYAFLRIVIRRPSETWDEGGIATSLAVRKVVGITVEEMDEDKFTLTEQGDDAGKLPGGKSDIWDRFALSIAHACGEDVAKTLHETESPGSFAAAVSDLMAGKSAEEKSVFARELSRLLSSLQHEKITMYRAQALEKLTEFVNNLSVELREMFLNNAFNLGLKADYAEGFFSELSDEVILEALKNVSLQKNYVPPVIMSLLSKLAGERNLDTPAGLSRPQANDVSTTRKIQELFRPDEFKKYVPSRYQRALMAVLQSETIPVALNEHLDTLRHTLETHGVDEHAAEITLHILKHNPDAEHLRGVRASLLSSIEHYLDVGDYANLASLCRLCFESHEDTEHLAEVRQELSGEKFIQRLLRDARIRGKQDFGAIGKVIICVGKPFIAPLLERVGDESNRNVRLFYLSCLKKLGRDVIDAATERLQDERWFVVRNIIYLLNEMDAQVLLPKLRPLLKHPHPKVRQEALKACIRMKDKSADDILIKGLESRKDEDVLNAIMLAPFAESRRVIRTLIELLSKKALIDYRLELKKNVVRTLAGMQAVAVLPTFREILSSRSLLHPLCHAELKLEIVNALDKFPPDKVKGLLQEQADSGTGQLAEQARNTLARMKGTLYDG